jgi:thioredoxin-related protein
MKKILSLALVAFALVAFVNPSEHSKLDIGDEAPMAGHEMKDISGESLSMLEMKKDAGVLVIFSCNTCPFVVGNGEKSEGWEGRYNELAEIAAKNGVGMVLVNSNEAKRDAGDSFEDMVAHAKTEGYKSHYVLDSKHELADAFGAKKTPHVFLFDKEMKLAYQGAIDDNVNKAKDVEQTWLKDALTAIAGGQAVGVSETLPMGCSIKRMK